MGGLYNVLFGVNKIAPVLLACLGLKSDDVPRFRDCYIQEGQIVIYTRTGGGNRDFYKRLSSCKANYPEYFNGKDGPSGPWNEDLQNHPNYLSDCDDDFDSTYAYFRFSFPDEYASELKALEEQTRDFTPGEKWNLLLTSLRTSAVSGEKEGNK